jgi:hypothetical protein
MVELIFYLIQREQQGVFRSHLRLYNLHLAQDWVDNLKATNPIAVGIPAPSYGDVRVGCATDDVGVDWYPHTRSIL